MPNIPLATMTQLTIDEKELMEKFINEGLWQTIWQHI
jgi:hypothetical protein